MIDHGATSGLGSAGHDPALPLPTDRNKEMTRKKFLIKVGTDELFDRSCDFCVRSEREDLQLEWVGVLLSCEDCIRLSEAKEEELNSNNGGQYGSEKESKERNEQQDRR